MDRRDAKGIGQVVLADRQFEAVVLHHPGVRAVRAARPDVWLGVDADQGYGGGDLDRLAAMLVDENVSPLEQSIARGKEALLDCCCR